MAPIKLHYRKEDGSYEQDLTPYHPHIYSMLQKHSDCAAKHVCHNSNLDDKERNLRQALKEGKLPTHLLQQVKHIILDKNTDDAIKAATTSILIEKEIKTKVTEKRSSLQYLIDQCLIDLESDFEDLIKEFANLPDCTVPTKSRLREYYELLIKNKVASMKFKQSQDEKASIRTAKAPPEAKMEVEPTFESLYEEVNKLTKLVKELQSNHSKNGKTGNPLPKKEHPHKKNQKSPPQEKQNKRKRVPSAQTPKKPVLKRRRN